MVADAGLGMGDQRLIGVADDLGGFLDKRHFFGALHGADFLHRDGAVFEFHLRQRSANLFDRSPGHDPFGRAHETGEADDADALGAKFF